MAKIEYLTRHHLSKDREIERIVAAARANAGLRVCDLTEKR